MSLPRLFPDFDSDAYEPRPGEAALRAEVRAFIDEEIARHEAGLPSGVLQIVTGPGEITGKAFGMHPDIDMGALTGRPMSDGSS